MSVSTVSYYLGEVLLARGCTTVPYSEYCILCRGHGSESKHISYMYAEK